MKKKFLLMMLVSVCCLNLQGADGCDEPAAKRQCIPAAVQGGPALGIPVPPLLGPFPPLVHPVPPLVGPFHYCFQNQIVAPAAAAAAVMKSAPAVPVSSLAASVPVVIAAAAAAPAMPVAIADASPATPAPVLPSPGFSALLNAQGGSYFYQGQPVFVSDKNERREYQFKCPDCSVILAGSANLDRPLYKVMFDIYDRHKRSRRCDVVKSNYELGSDFDDEGYYLVKNHEENYKYKDDFVYCKPYGEGERCRYEIKFKCDICKRDIVTKTTSLLSKVNRTVSSAYLNHKRLCHWEV